MASLEINQALLKSSEKYYQYKDEEETVFNVEVRLLGVLKNELCYKSTSI